MDRKPSSELETSITRPTPSTSLLSQIRTHAFSILSVGFGIASLAMILASTLTPTGQFIGENLVLTEVQVLPGLYMKPITFFQFSLFLSFAFGLYTPITRRRFLSARACVLRTVYILAWLIAMGSGFEILYHIVIWSAALAVQGVSNPDVVVNLFPISVNPAPINVVFASKIVVAIFFMALFLIDYVHRIDRLRQQREFANRATSSL